MAAITTTVAFLRSLLQDNKKAIWPDDDELVAALNAKAQPMPLVMVPEIDGVNTGFVAAENPLRGPLCLLDANPSPIVQVEGATVADATIRPCNLRVTFPTPLQSAQNVVVRGMVVDVMGVAVRLLRARATQLLNVEHFNTAGMEMGGGADYKGRADTFLKLANEYEKEVGLKSEPLPGKEMSPLFPPGQIYIAKEF